MNPRLERFLERLEGVVQTGPTAWIARCPAHPDRNPSLAIAEGERQPVVVKCFAGCPLEAILGAVELRPGDLMVDQPAQHRVRGRRRRYTANELLHLAASEAMVVAVAATSRTPLTQLDKDRVLEAARRLQEIIRDVG